MAGFGVAMNGRFWGGHRGLARCFDIIAAIARRRAQCGNRKKEIKYLASKSHKHYRYRRKKRIRIRRIKPTGTYIGHPLYVKAPPMPCGGVPYFRHFAENGDIAAPGRG